MKPCLALDGDGVLVDFDNPALDYLRSRGIHKTYEQITNWSVFDDDEQLENDFKRDVASHPDFCRNLKPLPGAIEFVKAAALVYDVCIVTAPYSVPNWYDGRKDWIVQNLGLSRKKVCFVAEKDRYDSDAFVDDKVENIVGWHQRYPRKPAILKDQPWNRVEVPSAVTRAVSWKDVSDALEAAGLPPVRGDFR